MRQKRVIESRIGFAAVCAVLLGAGLILRFVAVGYSFSALICFGLLGLVICYRLLRLLETRFFGLARALRLALNCCVTLGCLVAGLTLLVICKESAGAADMPCGHLVVLGAGVHGTTPSPSLQDRLDATERFARENPEVILIVSGGQGPDEDISEAQCMYEWLVAAGVAPERIWMEDRATSTEENLRFSLDLIEEKTGARPEAVGVLSSEYHMLRAKMFGQKIGVQVYGVPAPTGRITAKINYFLREIAGVWHEIILGG